jgi:hypothetical protein
MAASRPVAPPRPASLVKSLRPSSDDAVLLRLIPTCRRRQARCACTSASRREPTRSAHPCRCALGKMLTFDTRHSEGGAAVAFCHHLVDPRRLNLLAGFCAVRPSHATSVNLPCDMQALFPTALNRVDQRSAPRMLARAPHPASLAESLCSDPQLPFSLTTTNGGCSAYMRQSSALATMPRRFQKKLLASYLLLAASSPLRLSRRGSTVPRRASLKRSY